mmetsp:Transcript_82297/g.233088  ORF Transcript_82297/g.233088 Transcript_82297/m.233088 type:complete len:110 (+) Transcript_82297:438-767(+)
MALCSSVCNAERAVGIVAMAVGVPMAAMMVARVASCAVVAMCAPFTLVFGGTSRALCLLHSHAVPVRQSGDIGGHVQVDGVRWQQRPQRQLASCRDETPRVGAESSQEL